MSRFALIPDAALKKAYIQKKKKKGGGVRPLLKSIVSSLDFMQLSNLTRSTEKSKFTGNSSKPNSAKSRRTEKGKFAGQRTNFFAFFPPTNLAPSFNDLL